MLTDVQMLVVFLSFTMGGVLRTLWGFLWKWLEDPDIVWQQRYTLSMVVSIVLTFIFAVTTFSTLDLSMEWNPMVAFTFITTGFTTNTIFNDIMTYALRPKTDG